MKILVVFLLIVLCFNLSLAQIKDYFDFRPRLHTGNKCGTGDHLNSPWRLVELSKLDTNIYKKNLVFYYMDLANCYFEEGYVNNVDKHENFLRLNRKALFHDPGNVHALHNLAKGYYRIEECEEAKKYWALYLKYAPSYYDELFEQDIKERCPD